LLALRGLTRPRPLPDAFIWLEIAGDPVLYGYLVLVNALVLGTLGFAIGRYEDRLARMSATDTLSGLLNRGRFSNLLLVEIARSLRYRAPLSLLLVDVDAFKQVNDQYGHAAGDAALCTVAECLRSSCRRTDHAARYGGDEFAVLLTGTGAEAGTAFADRLAQAVRGAPAYAPGSSPLTLSIGVAELHAEDGGDPKRLLKRADAAMYAAKHGGRNRAVLAAAPPPRDRDRDSGLTSRAP